ncbi:hypothetical protein RJ639_013761 [Escallonia herrerae]|uniref:Sec1-like protein n=1 Tax=Escallonia herrerae TaxID=1293975 RepID=A0AA88VKP8_9ASTE|nr:hypothetical protein RJ639_013761 [Escallonia herrerae]
MALCNVIDCCLDSIRQVLQSNSNLDSGRKIVVIASCLLSNIAHSAYPDSPLGPDAYQEYESLLVQDYEELIKRSETTSRQSGYRELKENFTEDEGWSKLTAGEEDASHAREFYDREEDVGQLVVSVHHFPLILCPFSPRVFVLPSEGSVAEAYLSTQLENSISPGLPSLTTGTLSDGDDVPPGATLTAQVLYHLAAKMDLKLEIYSIGDLSKTVGKLLTDMSSLYDVGRRRQSAGLLLIDRTLDLLTPSSHGDSLVDRIFSSFPRREQTTSSSQIKGTQTELKHRPVKLNRAPLDVQIPIAKILSEEDSTITNVRLLESVEAFLRGWDSSGPASQMSELINFSTKLNGENSWLSYEEILKGSFVSSENFHGTPYLEALLDRRTKDGTILVQKWLQEAIRQENISVNATIRPGYASKAELQAMVKALAKSQSSFMKNKGIIQLAAATLYAMDDAHSARWDAFISAEKMLNVCAGDTSQSLAAQISDIINKSYLVSSRGATNVKVEPSQGLLSFQDALLLTVTGYMLAGENFPTSGSGGPFSWQEEHFLKEAIVDAVLENPEAAKLKFVHDLREELEAKLKTNKLEENEESSDQLQGDDFDDDQWGDWDDEDADKSNSKEQVYSDLQLKLELRDRVDNLFIFFHKLSTLKRNIPLREGALGLESNFSGDSLLSKGLLYKLLKRVLGKFDVPGLEYHSSTVGRLFKSGFGRFGIGQAKPSLGDQNVILVFVMGGISAVEVREAQEALSESGRPDIELILGGTTLLTPNDMFNLLLGDSSYT